MIANLLGTLFEWGVPALFWTLSFAPLLAAFLLLRRWLSGASLPGWGLAAIYFGAPLWSPVIAWHSAFHEPLRAWVGFPFAAGALLAAAYSLSLEPPRSKSGVVSESVAFLFLGFLAMVTFAGGYFDAMPLAARGMQRFRASGLDPNDPKALAAAFDDADPFVGYGAMIELQRQDKRKAGVGEAYTKALAARHPRTRRTAAMALGAGRAALSTSTLVSLLDSPDSGVRERVAEGLKEMGATDAKAALAAAGR